MRLWKLKSFPVEPYLDGDKIITPDNGSKGVDIYVSTSSAGGGLANDGSRCC